MIAAMRDWSSRLLKKCSVWNGFVAVAICEFDLDRAVVEQFG